MSTSALTTCRSALARAAGQIVRASQASPITSARNGLSTTRASAALFNAQCDRKGPSRRSFSATQSTEAAEWQWDPRPNWDKLPASTDYLSTPLPAVVEESFRQGQSQRKYAVVMVKGKKYEITPGDVMFVDKIDADVNDVLTFPDVLTVGCHAYTVKGTPVIQTATVYGVVEEHMRLKKIRREHFKKRKNYHRVWGHRQQQTLVRIVGIDFDYVHEEHPEPIYPLSAKPNSAEFSNLPFEEQLEQARRKTKGVDRSLPGQNWNQFPDYLANSKNEYRTPSGLVDYIRGKFGC